MVWLENIRFGRQNHGWRWPKVFVKISRGATQTAVSCLAAWLACNKTSCHHHPLHHLMTEVANKHTTWNATFGTNVNVYPGDLAGKLQQRVQRVSSCSLELSSDSLRFLQITPFNVMLCQSCVDVQHHRAASVVEEPSCSSPLFR